MADGACSPWTLTPHMRSQGYPVRSFAGDLIATLDRYGGNLAPAYDEVMPLLDRFLREPDLLALAVHRDGNHTPASSWLYYDYELEIHLSTFPANLSVPVHDHGTWEFVAPYRGEFSYTSYRRVDDGSVAGHAELEVVQETVLRPGDAAVCGPPPDDIHTFTPLTNDVLLLGMNHGPLAPQRAYYDPVSNRDSIRDSKAWRTGLTSPKEHCGAP